jgi:hypothetical protein
VAFVRWNFWSTWLGFGAALATATAGVGFIASAKAGTWLAIVAGVLAILAAAATAANTAFQPRLEADKHKRASDAYTNLRKDLRDFLDLTLAREGETAYDTYKELAQRRRSSRANRQVSRNGLGRRSESRVAPSTSGSKEGGTAAFLNGSF